AATRSPGRNVPPHLGRRPSREPSPGGFAAGERVLSPKYRLAERRAGVMGQVARCSVKLVSVQFTRLNPSQRNVIVVGLGAALYFAGQWIMTWGGAFGWVAYAPLSKDVSGPFLIRNPWAQFLIWLGL